MGRVHWLRRDVRTLKLLQWGEWLFYLGISAMALGILALYGWVKFQVGKGADAAVLETVDDLEILLLMAGLMTVLLIPVFRLSAIAMKRELGTDGKSLLIRLEDGRQLAVPPGELLYTKRMVLYRRYALPLYAGNRRSLYCSGELDTWLAPLLGDSVKANPIEAFSYRWQHRDSLLIWSVLFAVAAGSLLLTLAMMDL